MADILTRHRKVWNNKPILRYIYNEWYEMIAQELKPGKTLELGSGSGNFKDYKPDIIASDIVKEPWLDMACDAHRIPLANSSISNIVMIDTLHHLQRPVAFFDEAYRVLKSGGKVIMLEPYPSIFSLLIYRIFHPEPFIFDVDFKTLREKNKKSKDPWDSNQAIPFLIFFKFKKIFESVFKKKFKLVKREKISYLLYPLSGGFEFKQLLPDIIMELLKVFEKSLRLFKNYLAFRCFVVLEKI